MRLSVTLLLLLLVPITDAAAQTVVGIVREELAGPVRGVFVSLVDPAGGRQGSGLTDASGRYAIRARAPGSYRLVAERIGYQSFTSSPFSLTMGQSHTVAITLTVAALRLPEMTVSSANRCRANPQSSAETARVWEEIRKALTVTAWLQQSDNAQFRVRSFDQALTVRLQEDGTERMTFHTIQGRRAFGAEPAARLSEFGFVQQNGERLEFFGPDAELLISPEFLAQHCFWLQRNSQRPGLLGLAFQPVRNRRQSEIQGALWIDEGSGALRFLEYDFVNLGFALDARYANGRTDFQQLPNGAWVVRNWLMTLPALETTGRRAAVTAAHREGGEVLDVLIDDTTSVQIVPRFAVQGMAWDSLRNEPLANTRVFLAGTPLQTHTNAQGVFLLDSVPRGLYYIALHSARLDSVPAEPPSLRIRVDSALTPIRLTTPGEVVLLARYCEMDELNKRALAQRVALARVGVVRIEVIHPETGAPLADVDARLLTGTLIPGSDLPAADSYAVKTSTNARGSATFCGIDGRRPFMITLGTGNGAFSSGPFQLPPERVLRLKLRFSKEPQR